MAASLFGSVRAADKNTFPATEKQFVVNGRYLPLNRNNFNLYFHYLTVFYRMICCSRILLVYLCGVAVIDAALTVTEGRA